MASKEELTDLANSINKGVKNSIEAGVASVIIPPDTKKLIAEISQAFDTDDIKKIERALNRIEKITSRLGVDLAGYNKSLANTVEQYGKERSAAELKIEDLKKRNIIAETKVIEKDGVKTIQAVILSKKVIKEREKVLKKDFIRLEKDERQFNREVKRAQSTTISTEKSEKIIKDEGELTERREELTKQRERLTKTDAEPAEGEGWNKIPDFLEGPLSMAKEFLMTPITMAQEFGDAIGDTLKGIKQLGKFIFGNFFKGLKAIGKSFGKLNKQLIMRIAFGMIRMLKWIAIGGLLIFVASKLINVFKWLWQKLKDFGNWISDKFSSKKDISKMTEEEKQQEIVERTAAIKKSEEGGQSYWGPEERGRRLDQERIDALEANLKEQKVEEVKDKVKEKIEDKIVARDEEGDIKPAESIGKFFKEVMPMIKREKDLEEIKKKGPGITELQAINNAIVNNAPTTNVTGGSTFSIPKTIYNDDVTFNRVAGQDV